MQLVSLACRVNIITSQKLFVCLCVNQSAQILTATRRDAWKARHFPLSPSPGCFPDISPRTFPGINLPPWKIPLDISHIHLLPGKSLPDNSPLSLMPSTASQPTGACFLSKFLARVIIDITVNNCPLILTCMLALMIFSSVY